MLALLPALLAGLAACGEQSATVGASASATATATAPTLDDAWVRAWPAPGATPSSTSDGHTSDGHTSDGHMSDDAKSDGGDMAGGDMAGMGDMAMTAAFGVLSNPGTAEVTLVRAASPAARTVELHETVASGGGTAMRRVDAGFPVPAGGRRELAPGGDHIMLIDLVKPLTPGERVSITLTFSDGSTRDVQALVKTTSAGDEDYDPETGTGQ